MKIFSAEQIKKWDTATTKEQAITSADLMQRAGGCCFQWLNKHFSTKNPVSLFCGKGGNGGDALVIAQLLFKAHYQVQIILTDSPEKFSADAALKWQQLHKVQEQILAALPVKGEGEHGKSLLSSKAATKAYYPIKVSALNEFKSNELSPDTLIIDAVFGTGLKAALKENEPIAALMDALNALPNTKISIDLPSGLMADQLPDKEAVLFKANYTLCFEVYKRSLLHEEGGRYAGKVILLDIGLSEHYKKSTPSAYKALRLGRIKSIYQPKNPYGHKGSFGTAVLVGGSYGKIGSIGLSAHAALRSGVGKVFIQSPTCGYEILQQYLPEAMFQPAGQSYVEGITLIPKAVFGIGPGFDKQQQSYEALLKFLKDHHHPIVLDADGLNLLAEHSDQLFPLIPRQSILTPHPKEFQRIFGNTRNTMEQVDLALQKAVAHQLIIVLKGHHTTICLPNGKCYYNLTGNPGMGTAGSGDVLTGIITSLMAQDYSPKNAALLGVYLHGLAGDLAAAASSQEAMIAGDIILHLGKAYRQISQ